MVDFYLPVLNAVIEFNGEQHYHFIKHFHSDGFTLEDQKVRDETLATICKERNIKLITIKWDQIDDMPEILSRELNLN